MTPTMVKKPKKRITQINYNNACERKDRKKHEILCQRAPRRNIEQNIKRVMMFRRKSGQHPQDKPPQQRDYVVGNPGRKVSSSSPVAAIIVSRKFMKPLCFVTLIVCMWLEFHIHVQSKSTQLLKQNNTIIISAQPKTKKTRHDKLKQGYWTNKTKLLPQVLYNHTCPGALTPLRNDRNLAPSVCSVYIHASPYDRSGAYVFHLLDGYAYSYYWGYHYAGACGETPHTADTQSLVTWLGLQDVLHLDLPCPNYETPNETHYYEHVLRSTDLYRRRFLYYKPNWFKVVKRQIHQHLQHTYPQEGTEPWSQASHRTVVVHIRRGDVMPCMLGWGRMRNTRFTPNQHYLDVIDYYAKPGDVVKIYSESVSYEPWDVFIERGYQLVLDGPLVDAWKAMMWDAHVLILSQSSFSYVPALFSRAKLIVYTPQFKSNPQPKWAIVPDVIMNKTMALRKEMLANCTFELEQVYGNDQQAYMKHRKMYTYYSANQTTTQSSKSPLLIRPKPQ
jgi:hypothetical protein